METTKHFIIILLFASLTTILYSQTDSTLYNGEPILIKSGFSFTEGPSVDKDGNVYFTDQPNDKIYKWNCETDEVTLFHDSPERSNGTFVSKNGNLLACADLNGKLISIDMNGDYKVLAEDYNGKQFNGPNDLWPSPSGIIYFTDPYYQRSYWERTEPELDKQRVYYLLPDGELKVGDEDYVKPNGIIGTPDGKNLYVADRDAGIIYRYDIMSDGSLTNKTPFANGASDGMTIDNKGKVYITTDYVIVFDKEGNQIAQITVPEIPSNVCFAGKDKNFLFITARTSVYKLSMNVNGVD